MSSAGTIDEIWRFPVKSMLGERIEQADVTPSGVLGDRAYALLDVESGNVVSAKSVKRFPGLLGCRAAFIEPPRLGEDPPAVRIELSDGTAVTSHDPTANQTLSDFFGHAVALATGAPEDFTIDQYHPDIEDVDPFGNRDNTVQQKLGAALFAQMGVESAVPAGSFMDVFPVSLLTTSTLARLAEIQPAAAFDTRRFRMNLTVGTSSEGSPPDFVENGWIGSTVAVGGDVRLQVTMPVPRCVMTTLEQEELPTDGDVLRALARHNRLDIMGAGKFPCAGVYAAALTPGIVRLGDVVRLG